MSKGLFAKNNLFPVNFRFFLSFIFWKVMRLAYHILTPAPIRLPFRDSKTFPPSNARQKAARGFLFYFKWIVQNRIPIEKEPQDAYRTCDSFSMIVLHNSWWNLQSDLDFLSDPPAVKRQRSRDPHVSYFLLMWHYGMVNSAAAYPFPFSPFAVV